MEALLVPVLEVTCYLDVQTIMWLYLCLSDYVDRTEQARGGALLPKHMLEVMDGEVDRLLILTNNNIIPIPYIIPRKVSI